VAWKNKGKQKTTHVTVNGVVDVERTIYWNKDRGTLALVDHGLGITQSRYSPGLREMACRACIRDAFVPASEFLARAAQVTISSSAIQELVERQGRQAYEAISQGQYGPDWTVEHCKDHTLVTGADGVMVPPVTEQQKKKRRVTEAQNRQKKGRSSAAKVGRPRRGSDGPYGEFKLVSFYDHDKKHSYAVGTSGDCDALGRLMRREACKLKFDQAKHLYAVTDGAEWIARQYAKQLPLERHVLDYYHLRNHVIAAAQTLYGEGTKQSVEWRENMMGYVWNQGSLVMLDRLGHYLHRHRSGPKADALRSLREYVAKRVNMTDYPSYRQIGYDTGSGPTESFCGTLTARLKGRGMHWGKENAQAIMALGSLYYSNLWKHYWQKQRAA